MGTFEFRKLFRADAVVRVDYKTTSGPLCAGVSFSKNLSQTGINIIIPEKMDKDLELKMKIYIENSGNPVEAKGKIVWQSPCKYVPKSGKKYYTTGVQIIDMSSEDAIRESDFVRNFLVNRSEEQNKDIVERIEHLREEKGK